MRLTEVLVTIVLTAGIAGALVTPAQKCRQGKNIEAGKYAACREKAEGKFALTNDATARATSLQKCLDKYLLKWSLLETKAAGSCPTTGDQGPIAAAFDATTSNVATALAGGMLPDCPADLLACQSDLATCQSIPNGQPLKTGQTTCYTDVGVVFPCVGSGSGEDGELQTGLARAYVDNGDGTISDTRTGLMWEKLSDDGSIHDKDTAYTFAGAVSGKIAALNTMGFAGHSDWRVPNRAELITLVNLGTFNPAVSPAFDTGCVPGCDVTTCSCTLSNYYWSSSSYVDGASQGWFVAFYDGYSSATNKQTGLWVRAVRGGS